MSAVIRHEGRPLRILHVLAASVPHVSGYTIRGKYLVDAQRRDGLDPIVVTSPYFPGRDASRVDTVLDGTRYLRVRHPLDDPGRLTPGRAFFGVWGGLAALPGVRRLRASGSHARRAEAPPGPAPPRRAGGGLVDLIRTQGMAARHAVLRRRFAAALDGIVARFQPDLIHAHSPQLCGLPALDVARRRRLPLVYEVRGLWEETRVASAGEGWRQSGTYRRWADTEQRVMAEADAVVCISEQVRQEVLARGAEASRVIVVPNAVDTSVFRPLAAAAEVPREARALRDRLPGPTLGYVGNLRALEGVDELVRGAAALRRRGEDVSLLVVGHGEHRSDDLRALARTLGLGERAIFAGPVPHEHAPHYYDLMDVFVISRPALRVTQMVTPLKPLEAMAMAKPVVISDLAALRELVIPGETGLVYPPGDVDALADACARLLADADLRRRLGEAARRWVSEHRTWSVVLRKLYPTYQALVERRRP